MVHETDPMKLNYVFYGNVKNICSIRRIRIGDLEKEVGVRGGFISRFRTSYGMTLISALKIAEALDVPLDCLCVQDGWRLAV